MRIVKRKEMVICTFQALYVMVVFEAVVFLNQTQSDRFLQLASRCIEVSGKSLAALIQVLLALVPQFGKVSLRLLLFKA